MKVYTVLVTYKPEMNRLNDSIQSLISQVDKIIIVNNYHVKLDLKNEKVMIIELGENKGIAFAQNRGIEIAEKENAEYVLLSDQDTVYPIDYIDSFSEYAKSLQADVFCPVFFDNIKKVYSPIMIGKFKSIPISNAPVYVEHAIASGSLIKTDVFDIVGKMDEELFIDYVDFEWCWRATSKGIKILTVPSIVINHNLGDGIKEVFGKQVTLRSDFRYFYILRNGFYLGFHCKYLSFKEKIHLLLRTFSFSAGVFILRHNMKILGIIIKTFVLGVTGKLKDF